MTAPTLDRERLAKVLGLLGSDHPGEVAEAAGQAERLRLAARLTWHDIILPGLPPPPRRESATADPWEEAIQIRAWSLPTRPTKATDSRAKGFGDISVELDAIEPNLLRDLVRDAIERHLPPDQFEVLKAAEASERHQLAGLVGMLTGGAA